MFDLVLNRPRYVRFCGGGCKDSFKKTTGLFQILHYPLSAEVYLGQLSMMEPFSKIVCGSKQLFILQKGSFIEV